MVTVAIIDPTHKLLNLHTPLKVFDLTVEYLKYCSMDIGDCLKPFSFQNFVTSHHEPESVVLCIADRVTVFIYTRL